MEITKYQTRRNYQNLNQSRNFSPIQQKSLNSTSNSKQLTKQKTQKNTQRSLNTSIDKSVYQRTTDKSAIKLFNLRSLANLSEKELKIQYQKDPFVKRQIKLLLNKSSQQKKMNKFQNISQQKFKLVANSDMRKKCLKSRNQQKQKQFQNILNRIKLYLSIQREQIE